MNTILKFLGVVFFLFIHVTNGQEYNLLGEKKSQTTRFKLISNLIIVPIKVNGAELSFIIDSGVGTPVIFNLEPSDSLNFNNIENVRLRGLGDGEAVDALRSKGNKIELGNMYTQNQDLYIIYNDRIDLSSKLGVQVNGIIGYDLFKDFVVTINYVSKKIKFTKSDAYVYKSCNKCEVFDLSFFSRKPYVNVEISSEETGKRKSVQLLIDSGSADSLWLFEDEENGIVVPENSFEDFIGEGISGSIFGMRSKIALIKLKSFEIKESNVAYLDSISTVYAKSLTTRNGSLGGGILKRFKVILDYKNSRLTLKKNQNFNDEFRYNMGGIELIYAGNQLVRELKKTTFNIAQEENSTTPLNKIAFNYRYEFSLKPVYKIAHIRKGSPGDLAGLLEGDYLKEINGKASINFDLQEIIGKFYSEKEKTVKLTIEREGKEMKFEFQLVDMLARPNM